MNRTIELCLDDLARRIDEDQENRNLAQWIAFCDGAYTQGVFTPDARTPAPPRVDWPAVNINDAIEDFDLMLLEQFHSCNGVLKDGSTRRLNVRCNYGTGILPSLFGCELFMMPRQTNTLPAVKPLADVDKIRRMVDAGVPDIRGGLGGKVFDMAQRFQEVFARYPVIGRNVFLFHPDLQGPIDVAEVVWGSDIFLAFYDEPDLVKAFLSLITDTYIVMMRKWYEMVPEQGPYTTHWGTMYKGRLTLRNDSLMNLPPEIFVEFIRPLDQKLLDELGGGSVHFCGRGDHYIEPLCQMRGLTSIQMSQPHLNDMEKIYRNTVDKGITLLGFDRRAAEAALSAGRDLRGRVHVD